MFNHMQELFVVGHDFLVCEGPSLDNGLEVLRRYPVEIYQGLAGEEVVLFLFGDDSL